MPIELTAQTDAGARLVALAEALAAELAARAAAARPRRQLPVRGDRRAPRGRLLRGARARPSSAGSASRPCTTSSWPRAAWRAATPPSRSA